MLTFHYCQLFQTKVEGLSIEKNIRSKLSDLSRTISLNPVNNISRFGSDIFVFKSFSPLYRIIFQKETINIDDLNEKIIVYFVRDIFLQKDFEYTYAKVIAPSLAKNEWLSSNPLSEEDKKDFVNIYKKEKLEHNDERKHIPENLTNWLNAFQIKINNDIFETEDWIHYSQSDSEASGMLDKYVNRFHLLLKIITSNTLANGDLLTKKNDIEIFTYKDDNYGVIYSKIYVDKEERYILFNGANLTNQYDHWEEAKNKVINSNIQLKNDLELLSRLAYRAYPKWALKDENLWFSIQKSSEMSNLSLTQEQIFFLQDFKFPHYINGQAGSGKSTMLNYIFANVYIDKCLESIQGDIIYLTENDNLIEDSKRCVIELLSNNPKMSGLDTHAISMITDKFSTFKKFLKSLLSEEEQFEFKDDKYLNYPLFKYLYENSYLPKHIINKYTAEECWFTIITYIFGYLPNITITSNEYISLIPKHSQIIPKEKFEGIEKHVLPFYNTLINDEGYWDKLKIIRYIYENEITIPNYSVVICDEAQDFCKVELKFILKLSEFLNYDLSLIDQVPIVFAGDPNQTVNPTGFRESEITSMIFEVLNNSAKFNIRRNDSVYNPKYNYRSSKAVVSLANFIQFFRKKNLGIRLLFPQETKKLENDNPYNFNTFISYENIFENPELKNDLIEKLKYKVFIVPVDAQSKNNYIQSYDLFQNNNSLEIKTSVEAKGTEYDQVVLFGFGEYFTSQFRELNQQNADSDEQFKVRFFFNKLYVGITRARTELLIIDTYASIQSFWKQLIEEVSISEDAWLNLNSIKQEIMQYDPNSIGHIIKSTKEDAFKNAESDRERGIYEQNSARLKVAATQFIKLGYKKEGYECLAESEIILKRFIKAANHYLDPVFENTRINEAANCYFLGRHFKEMIEETSKMLNTPEQGVRLVIARLVSGNVIMKKDIEVLNKNRNVLKQLIKDLDWRSEIITALETNSKKIIEKELKEQYVEILYEIANSKDIKLWVEIGEIYYDLRKFDSAVASWNVIDYFDSEKYIISQIEIAKNKKDIENHVLWLDELYKTTNDISSLIEIQDLYNNHKSFRSSKASYYFSILRSYLLNNKHTDIITLTGLLESCNDLSYLIFFFKELLKIEDINSVIRLLLLERMLKATYKINIKEDNDFWLIEFNKFYSQIAEKFNIPFIEYDITEIINIPDQLRQITIKPSSHFTSFKISNFRQFSNISIENIGKYNLILGNNNVGKTSILESLLFTLPYEKFIQELGIAYIERTNLPRFRDSHGIDYYNINESFLVDFVNNTAEKKEVSFELINHRNIWHYNFEIIGEKLISDNQQGLMLRIFNDNNHEDISLGSIIENIKYSKISASQFIPYGKGFNNELASTYLTHIDTKKSEREGFVKSLQVFIPRIERIIVDTQTGQILIEETDKEVPIPLHQYGEGAIKLFRILLQIAVQKGKKILVDEIDSGIHYSNFSSFWKNIIHFCNIYDVQIFATTHNFECINYFKEILNDRDFEQFKDNSRIITLRQLPNNQIKAYTRVFEEFEYEIDNNFEIRGGELL